ncbi:MAG: phasin family protein [Xanthobacteraceae bacterium]
MARTTTENFDIPPEMRAFTEKSVEQAQQAFEGFMSAARHTVGSMEDRAALARQSAKDVGQAAMTFAERNIASSFEHAQRLVRARNVEEMLKLHADHVKNQMQSLAEQAKNLGEQTSEIIKDTTR